jgi:hypothetical protein
MNIRTVVLMTLAGLIIATTANAGNPEIQVWRDADLNVWQAHYGKPVRIENSSASLNLPDDGSRQYYWNFSRFEVEATFLQSGKLSCFNIEARQGNQALTFTEAKALADKLGFGPYHLDDGDPAWGDPTAQSATAFFQDAAFHFEAVHEDEE